MTTIGTILAGWRPGRRRWRDTRYVLERDFVVYLGLMRYCIGSAINGYIQP
jgi:hypothetical protein